MKKEYFLITAGAFFVLAYVLDYLAGPISITLAEANPFTFLSQSYLNNYPLTAVAVVIRAVGLFICAAYFSALLKKMYFIKFIAALIIGVLAELYAIQQIATGMRTTSIQWTLSIAYAGALLGILVILYFIIGIINFLKQKLVGETYVNDNIKIEEKPVTNEL